MRLLIFIISLFKLANILYWEKATRYNLWKNTKLQKKLRVFYLFHIYIDENPLFLQIFVDQFDVLKKNVKSITGRILYAIGVENT